MMARFGFADIGYVAVVGSPEQAVVCSVHTVVGMFLLASASVTSLTVCRLYSAGSLSLVSAEIFGTVGSAARRSA
jgi:hypothetical protein